MRVAYRLAALLAALVTALTLIATAPASAARPSRTLWKAYYSGTGNSAATDEAVSPDGSTVYVTGYTGYNSQTGATGGTTIAYDAATGTARWTQPTPSGSGYVLGTIAVSPDGSTVFVSGYNNNTGGAVTIAYSAATGATQWTQQDPGVDGAASLAVSPDGSKLYLMNGDSVIVAYATATGHRMWATSSIGDATVAGALSADGSTVVITGFYATAAYNAVTGAQLWVRHYGSNSKIIHTSSAAVSSDGSLVYVGGYGGHKGFIGDVVRAYDGATGATRWTRFMRQTSHGSEDTRTSLGVSPDGSTLFVSGAGRHSDANGYSFWVTQARDASTGKLLWSRNHGAASVDTGPFSLAVSPDGSAVYVTGSVFRTEEEDGKTVAYNAATGTQKWASYEVTTGIDSPTVVAPDGSKVFVCGHFATTPSDYGTTAFRS
jgi:outer membrane protein assembly factor BamB